MKMHLMILGVVTSLLVVCMSGCVDISDEEKIIGIWDRVNYDLKQTWEFTREGNLTISGSDLEMSYIFNNGSLFTIVPSIAYVDAYQYSFDGNDVLILNFIPQQGGISDPATGDPINIDDSSIMTEFIFHRIS